ncbi:MAG: hypothetical protein QF357_06270 [Dehalococcoidia bacterium]|nr:hypothetical protein [Dehalococcoidia bacterium]
MNKPDAQLRRNPRIVPPDLQLRFGYSPSGGIEYDSAADTLGFYQGGTERVDISSLGLAVRNGDGLVVGHTAQVTGDGALSEFQMLGTGTVDSRAIFGRWSADENPGGLIFLKSRDPVIADGTFAIVNDGDGVGILRFAVDDGTDYNSIVADFLVQVDGTPGANDSPGRIVFRTTADGSSDVTEALRIDSSQNVQMRNESYLWIGLDSAATGFVDATLVTGLVINQEAEDGNIIVLKSSDITQPATGIQEADTYARFSKISGTDGGLRVVGATDADGSRALLMEAYSGDATPDATNTNASTAIVETNAFITDGGTSIQAAATADNIFAVRNAGTTVLLVEGDGDQHVTTVDATNSDSVAATALDYWDDAGLVRTLTALTQKDLIKNKWDETLRYNEQSLIDAGIIGEAGLANGALMNQSQLLRLYGGAIWQGASAHMSLVERVDELEGQLALANKQLAALTV